MSHRFSLPHTGQRMQLLDPVDFVHDTRVVQHQTPNPHVTVDAPAISFRNLVALALIRIGTHVQRQPPDTMGTVDRHANAR